MPDWRDKVILGPGESLRVDNSRCDGFMQETDVYNCSIIDANGVVTGTVRATDHTAVKGFRRTLSIKQTDGSGNIIFEDTWTA